MAATGVGLTKTVVLAATVQDPTPAIKLYTPLAAGDTFVIMLLCELLENPFGPVQA